MQMAKWILFVAVAVLLVIKPGSSCAETANAEALRRVVTDACKANVVFLGEPAHHGSAKAVEFKSAVAEALVEKCGFSAIVFESSFYESLYVNRLVSAGKPVDATMQLNVIGELWTATQEFQSFDNFLFEKTSRG